MLNPTPVQQPHPPVWCLGGATRHAPGSPLRRGLGALFLRPRPLPRQRGEDSGFAAEESRRLDGFQWGFFPYISIYPTEKEAAEVAAHQLGGQYLYGGEFINIVRRYCLLGTPEQCAERLREYVDAGARHIVFSITCPPEDRERHLEDIARKLIPLFRQSNRIGTTQ